MTNQERAKAAVKKVEAKAIPFEGENFYYPYDKNILDLLHPIAAGTHVIVPIEPTQHILDVVTAADQTEPFSDATMTRVYQHMIAASQEGE